VAGSCAPAQMPFNLPVCLPHRIQKDRFAPRSTHKTASRRRFNPSSLATSSTTNNAATWFPYTSNSSSFQSPEFQNPNTSPQQTLSPAPMSILRHAPHWQPHHHHSRASFHTPSNPEHPVPIRHIRAHTPTRSTDPESTKSTRKAIKPSLAQHQNRHRTKLRHENPRRRSKTWRKCELSKTMAAHRAG
jgi:hypothetical protein